MKNLLRNFWLTLTRFRMASVLNLLGLTVAFAVFIVIMSQTYWELTFNKGIKQQEQIFFLTLDVTRQGDMQTTTNLSRPYGELIGQSSPAIEAYSPVWSWGWGYFSTLETQGATKEVNEQIAFVSSDFPRLLSLECLAGDFKRFQEPKTIIISKSVAETLFPDSDPIGNSIINKNRGDTLQIVAVFQNLPENGTINSGTFINIGDWCIEDYNEWSFYYYYKLNSPNAKSLVEAQATQKVKETFTEESDDEEEDDEEETEDGEAYSMSVDVKLTPFSKIYYEWGSGNRTLTNLLGSIAILIMLIAIINYINFFMAMVPLRIRNININKVFGTPTSALRLNIIGEAVGLLLLSFGLALFVVEYLSGTFINDLVTSSLKVKDNLFLVSVTGVLAVVTGVLAGLFPAFYITKFNPAFVLKGAFGRSKQGQRLRSVLVVFQFTISIALIICAYFVHLQSRYMQKFDYGFNRDRLATVWVGGKIASQPQTFLSELRKNPAIEGVAYADASFVNIGMKWGRNINGEYANYTCIPVSWNYPEFMGLKLKEGRFFIEEDASKPGGSYIFNETAAKKYELNVGDFLGGHSDEYPAEIVGIVEDFNFASLQNSIEPIAIYEFGSTGWRIPSLAYIRLNNSANFQQTADYIASCMLELNPNLEPDKIKINPFDKNIESLYSKEIKITKIISLFSIVTIIISLMGVFGIVVFENQHRRKEIALRKIHGSTTTLILGMFNRKFLIILSISAVIAIPVAYFGITKWLSGFAYRTPVYWWVFAGGVLVVALITLLTVTLQTFRVANENPIRSIKTE
jgi:putative ABC transport system permease protein